MVRNVALRAGNSGAKETFLIGPLRSDWFFWFSIEDDLDRSRVRPGMVTGSVVAAFRSIGWGWGGSWSGTKDYMHFSANGH